MKKLVKTNSGEIETINFGGGIPAPYFLNPTTANLQFTHPGIVIVHSNTPQSILRPLEWETCVIDIDNTYNPLNSLQMARISIYDNDNLSIDLEEYYDSVAGTTEAYPYIRIIKISDSYQFFWSNDKNTWNLLGVQILVMDSPQLKIELTSGDMDYILNSIHVYSSLEVQFRGLISGDIVTLSQNGITQSGTVGENSLVTNVDISKFPDSIYTVSIVRGGTEIFNLQNSQIIGGDVYDYMYFITLKDENGNILETEQNIYFGDMPGMYVERKLIMQNDSGATLNNITLTVKQRGSNNSYLKVQLAKDYNGIGVLQGQSLTYNTIADGQQIIFWVHIDRDTSNVLLNSVDFTIEIVVN